MNVSQCLGLIDRQNFYPFRGQLRGDVENKDIEEVVNVLSDLGVQMKSDTQVHFDTETEMGQAKANGRRFDEDIESKENLNVGQSKEGVQNKSVTLQQKETNGKDKGLGGNRSNQRSESGGLRDALSDKGAKASGDRVDIGSLSEGLATEQRGDNERSQRKEQETVGHKIIDNAKKNGSYIERTSFVDFGERKKSPSGKSIV